MTKFSSYQLSAISLRLTGGRSFISLLLRGAPPLCHCEAQSAEAISHTLPGLPRLGPSLRSGFQLTAMTDEVSLEQAPQSHAIMVQ